MCMYVCISVCIHTIHLYASLYAYIPYIYIHLSVCIQTIQQNNVTNKNSDGLGKMAMVTMYICIHVDCVARVQCLSVCTFVCMHVCMHVNLYATTIVTLHCVETHIHVCHVLTVLSVCMIIYTCICACAMMSV